MAELANTGRAMDDNPYVGPRTFIREEASKFFGRDREARHLIALIISEQLVLFYAQSGAGKSSLLNTKVVPGLEKEGFEVLPVGAVRGHSGFDIEADNIFIYNLISSLQQKDEAIAGQETMTLSEFLDCLVYEEGAFHYNCDYVYAEDEVLKPRVLLIDQFEEILTTNTTFWAQREDFFRQLAQAMAMDDQLWVVLTMREDFVGGLEPYLHLLPNALQNHFYMRRLNRDAALEAITKPVEKIRPFEDEAAQILVDNLRKIEVKEREREVHWGEFVEPVQLQAVCYQMWEKLKVRPGKMITKEDVAEFADVDTALINFYEDTIAAAVAETGVSEIDLRAWFENDLVTEAGTRNIIYRGDEYTGSLPTSVADYLNSRFIIREIARPGGVWFELIHDRFVEPIIQANQKWRLDQPLIQLCQEWLASGRSKTRLLSSQQLDNYADTNWQALGPLVAEFMAASQTVREKEAEQAAERQRRLTRTAFVLLIVAVVASIVAIIFFFDARNDSIRAEDARATAEAEATRAIAAELEAIYERDRAEMAMQAAQNAVINQGGVVETVNAERDKIQAEHVALLESLITATARAFMTIPVPDKTPEPTETENVSSEGLMTATPTAEPTFTSTPSLLEDLVSQLATIRPTQTAVTGPGTAREIIVLGRSVEGIEIEAHRFGNGSQRILLVGGIHAAKSPSTVTIAKEIIAYYDENLEEIPENITLYVVPNLNPDSNVEAGEPRIEGRYNANGVDLNRNWNCQWQEDPFVVGIRVEGAGGTAPLSEPESSALADFIRRVQPAASVAWYARAIPAQIIPGGCPITISSENLAQLYAQYSGYVIGDYITGEIPAGDFTNWMDSIGIPTIGVLLRSDENPDFENNVAAVQRVMEFYAQQ